MEYYLIVVSEVAQSKAKDARKKNDILGVWEKKPNFTPREKERWDAIPISELEYNQFKQMSKRRGEVYKTDTTEWTFSTPQRKEGWADDEGNIYEVCETPWSTVHYEKGSGFTMNYDTPANRAIKLFDAKKRNK